MIPEPLVITMLLYKMFTACADFLLQALEFAANTHSLHVSRKVTSEQTFFR
jgi:hypothetical protein